MSGKKLLSFIHILGYLMIVLGIILCIPLILSIFLREGNQIYLSFIIPIILALTVGILGVYFGKEKLKLDMASGMVLCVLGWLIASSLGAIPFIIALEKGFVDALFESVSGFTTTGITVFQNLEQISFPVLLWRSLIQWLGGLGILTFFLLVTFRSEGEVWKLFTAESHKINNSRPVPNIFRSIEILWGIYLIFTVVQFLLMLLLQVSPGDAIIHSLTTISTGGFSNYDSSIAYFQESGYSMYRALEYVIIIFMLFGGINFLVHYNVFQGKIKELFFNPETKNYWKILLIFIIIIFVGHFIEHEYFALNQVEEVFRKTLFQVVSIMTTTGYETEHIGARFFPVMARQLFLVLMLIGGCVGSTSGGVKVIRVSILSKLFYREIKKINSPRRAINPVVIDNKIISLEEIQKIAGIFFAWLILILLGGLITALFSDLTAGQSISGMFSAVGNIGPSYISVEQMSQLSPVIKITYIFGMLAGRLEILPLFVLFSRHTWR